MKKALSLLLSILLVFSSITCLFTVNATAATVGENMIIPPNSPTSAANNVDNYEARTKTWIRSSGDTSIFTTMDDIPVVGTTRARGYGQLFTNVFALEKNPDIYILLK